MIIQSCQGNCKILYQTDNQLFKEFYLKKRILNFTDI